MDPRHVGLWISFLLFLQACSTTPFGRQLADSFDPPPDPPAATANAQPKQEETKPEGPKQEEPKPQRPGSVQDTVAPTAKPGGTAKPANTAKTQAPAQPSTVVKPQPYRITIRLSGADPAAPAELVTRSLRDAGIPFEVETIERINPAGGTASGATPSPAATP